MLTDELVQAVRDTVDILDIAGEMTRLKRVGKRYKGLCPFHKEKTPSFGVDPVQGFYHCFGCGAGGDAIRLYQEQTGDDFPAAIEALARRYGIPVPAAARTPYAGERRDLRTVLEAAADFFRHQLRRSEFARRYLERRQIPAELIERYQLGYAPDGWRALLEGLRGRFKVDDLLAAGLLAKSERAREPYDRFRHRLMFPIHGPSGRLLGFGGRTLGDDRAKYINTSETESFHKGSLLYGFHHAKRPLRDGGRAILVEGYFDVLGTAACGFGEAVAGMGTSLTAAQARLLSRYCDRVVIAYDGDEAGETAHRRALPILLAAGLGVTRARLPAGHDPDSLRLESGPEEVRALVEGAADAVDLEIDRLAPGTGDPDPQTRSRAAGALAEVLRPIRDPIARLGYVQRAAERLGLPEDLISRRILRQGRPGGRPGAEPASGEPASGEPAPRSPGQAVEEKAVALLLHQGTPIPSLAELPPPEVFFDPGCRGVYSIFRALCQEAGGEAPAASEVIARLDREQGAVERLARVMLEQDEDEERGLRETFDTLLRRWHKQRQTVLMRQIKEAESAGDRERLARLLEEKKALSRSLHPAMSGKVW